ncbi:Hypothetical predicted protein [Olea europaea subsp. europaea]|uniref:Uncharacterized protein n=1 Tax=Olea europaea subsp. europaea TaxID=158383 RepID=A0A8S0PV69_OLEEU|nr:Hypothetical predicted protein [Olea europaea subsp. europaea]
MSFGFNRFQRGNYIGILSVMKITVRIPFSLLFCAICSGFSLVAAGVGIFKLLFTEMLSPAPAEEAVAKKSDATPPAPSADEKKKEEEKAKVKKATKAEEEEKKEKKL